MKFTFSIPQTDIDKAYQIAVNHAVKHTSIKGFRTGRAPKNQVIAKVGEHNLQQQAIEAALPSAYSKAINSRKLKPIGFPKIELKSGGKDKTWEFEAEIAEKPPVNLNNYTQALQGLIAGHKIWTPKTPNTQSDLAPDSQDQKLKLIFEKLLSLVQVDVPQLLIDQEVNRQLSRLIDQTNRLGLNLDDYLKATGHTQSSLKKQYTATATDTLKLEFIIQAIAQDQQIQVTETEIADFLQSLGDKSTPKVTSSTTDTQNIHYLLLKRKTIQKLIQLAS